MNLRPIPGAPSDAPIPDFPTFTPKAAPAPPSAMPRAVQPAVSPPPVVVPEPPPDPVTATVLLAGKKEGETLETRRHESGAISFCFGPGTLLKLDRETAHTVVKAAREAFDLSGDGPLWVTCASYADEIRFRPWRAYPGVLFIATKVGARGWADAIWPRTAEERTADIKRGRERSEHAQKELATAHARERTRCAELIKEYRNRDRLGRHQLSQYDTYVRAFADTCEKQETMKREARLPPLIHELEPWFVVHILTAVPTSRDWGDDLAELLTAMLPKANLRWQDEIEEAIRIAAEQPAVRRREWQMVIAGWQARR